MEEALSVDLSVLEALLRRNRCSHGRTQYHKRMAMAVRALKRSNLPEAMDALKRSLQAYRTSSSRQEWVLGQDDGLVDATKQIQNVKELLAEQIPQVVSRIEYASSALFVEVARGFFLPFCTVALGALARIRILLFRFGREGVTEFQALLAKYKLKDECNTDWFEDAMKSFVEKRQGSNKQEDQRRLLASFGMTPAKKTGEQGSKPTILNVSKEEKVETSVENETDDMQQDVDAISDADHDDVGENVGSVAAMPREAVNTSSPTTKSLDKEDADRNLELLQSIKSDKKKSSDRKRSAEGKASSQKKKKKRKKAKRKKDFFDDIFDGI